MHRKWADIDYYWTENIWECERKWITNRTWYNCNQPNTIRFFSFDKRCEFDENLKTPRLLRFSLKSFFLKNRKQIDQKWHWKNILFSVWVSFCLLIQFRWGHFIVDTFLFVRDRKPCASNNIQYRCLHYFD